ncbi:MAG: hypothetical protein WC455_19720 [Dehalococcoidia bacterium]|jgi:hypothetical protein
MTGGGIPVIRYDLAHFGIVTSVTSPTIFTVAGLAGFGVGAFIGYSVYINRKATGTGLAPQGETQAITAYVNLSGQFTIAAGYTVSIAVGDEVLVVPTALIPASQIAKLAGMPGTNGNIIGNWQAAETDIVTIGAALLRIKIHNLTIGIAALAGNITLRLYTDVNGVQRRIFPIPAATTFSVAGDAPAIPLINGTFGFRNAVRVTAQSDNILDNGALIEYDYLVEAM